MSINANATSSSMNSSSPIYFRGGNSPLSNFYESPLHIWNMNFRSSEHAYQYKKCMTLGNNEAAKHVLSAPKPLDAKRIGDAQNPSNKWEDVQQGIMCELLRSKLRQCPAFLQTLKDSQNRPLIEDTPNWFWGRGRDGLGLNMLGQLLMMLRSEVSAAKPQSFTPRPPVAPYRDTHGHTHPLSRQQQLRCFNCGEASHTKSTCRHPSPLNCYSCDGLGHKQKFCKWTH